MLLFSQPHGLVLLPGVGLHDTLVWAGLTFSVWLILILPLRRLGLPKPVAVAAALSWIAGRVLISATSVIVHWIHSIM